MTKISWNFFKIKEKPLKKLLKIFLLHGVIDTAEFDFAGWLCDVSNTAEQLHIRSYLRNICSPAIFVTCEDHS